LASSGCPWKLKELSINRWGNNVFPPVLLITGSGVALFATGVARRRQAKKKSQDLLRVHRQDRGLSRKQNARGPQGVSSVAERFCARLTPRHSAIALEDADIISIEEWSGRYFAASSVALPLALLGIWAPVLNMPSIAILSMLTLPILQRSYKGLVQQKRLKMDSINVIVLPLMIVSGYLPAAAVGYWTYYLGIMFLARAKRRSTRELKQIISENVQFVWIENDGVEVKTAFRDLRLGDVVVIQGGGMVPVDGVVVRGVASIDQRMLTGEAQPAEKEAGDAVFAFTTVLGGKVWIRAERTGQQTVALQINQALAHTYDFAASVESRVEAAADCLALPTLALGALAWPVAGYTAALIVLDSAIIDNLYITGNLSILTHLSSASRKMLLIKDGLVLERLQYVDTVVFDKTGTLTADQPHVEQIHICDAGFSESLILYYAAIAEHKQSHPIAMAILKQSEALRLTLPSVDDTHYEVGYGIRVRVDDDVVRVGSGRYMELENLRLTDDMKKLQAAGHAQGYSFVYVAVGEVIAGVIELHPTVRPEAKRLVKTLKRRGLTTFIISGDHDAPTKALAAELGIDHSFAETLPEEKALRIAQLQEQGNTVCFIGDGINDAIALKKADVAVSLRGASSIATDTAQVILLDGDLRQVASLFELTDHLQKNFRNSVLWDVVPNATSIVGAYFFHLGIYGALAIYAAGLAGGVVNGMLPLMKK
jgi:heavy metal translocating P-type ATPase